MNLLANSTALPESAATGYALIGILLAVVVTMGVAIVATTLLPKKKRHGSIKDGTYEAGMEPIGDARRRFNITFYLIAMVFLLFDVELVFMYPWAPVFWDSVKGDPAVVSELAAQGLSPMLLMAEMAIFAAILLIGFAYAWRKRIFPS